MKNPFNDPNLKVYSFSPDGEALEYSLSQISSQELQELRNFIMGLEHGNIITVCTRGYSFRTREEHDSFINKQLAKFFIVGMKARTHVTALQSPYSHVRLRGNILHEISQLVDILNKWIVERQKNKRDISGKISRKFLKKLDGCDLQLLERYKLLLLAALHNKGNLEAPKKFFKYGSPFQSLSKGVGKYNSSLFFAMYRRKKIGDSTVIFVYALNRNWPYYFENKQLISFFKNLGVKWFEDVHSEVLLLNGLYPHSLIGFFELERTSEDMVVISRFILNPWFYNILNGGGTFDPAEGVRIDQRNFLTLANELGYKTFFFHKNGDVKEFVRGLRNHTYFETLNP